METFQIGSTADTGSYRCRACGFALTLQAGDELPECPGCGGGDYGRSGLFDRSSETVEVMRVAAFGEEPDWLEETRVALSDEGFYIAFESRDGIEVLPLGEGWTRIGRSLSADLRIDDPTVSRRHALVHRDGRRVKILDDRSLNGVFRNGERVDIGELADGDSISVGRFELHFVQTAAVPQPLGAGA